MDSENQPNGRSKDPGWKYVTKGSILGSTIFCFCKKITHGGIYRAKQYLAGGYRNSKGCQLCPAHVREEMREYLELLRQNKQNAEVLPDFDDVEEYGYDEVEEVGNGSQQGRRKFQAQPSKKQKGVKGPMDMFFTSPPEQVVKNRKDGKMKQSTINEICKKDLGDKACKELANWFYDAGLPFNVVNHDSFRIAMEAVAQHGTGFKPPSYHEVRVPYLAKAVKSTDEMVKQVHHEQWAKYGCSLMSDGWRDSVAHKDIINFLVNSPRGSVFVRSTDASNVVKNSDNIYMMLDQMMEEIREQNVVQVVINNAPNYKAAGKLLMAKRKHLYWTPCAAHCIDLMLEDIGNIQRVRQTLKRAITLNGYIYNRTGVVNMMRKFTGKRELLRPATTRFATAIQVQKIDLRKMFTSDTWTKSKYAKEQAGKHVASIVAMPTFWSNIMYILKLTGPIVSVLRLVDGEKKPAMGYIYHDMRKAKEAISSSFNGDESKYKDVFAIIDKRWECQLHHPLHASGYYLNPRFYYSDPDIEEDPEVSSGMHQCIMRLIPNKDDQSKLTAEKHMYRNASFMMFHGYV
ncbi:3-hydroxyisobutyryl-CoA hydrolase 1-like protein [Tanacetum coccineum]|uniref:3-hydroxyisobutyryl-CoA hydrolase 1-like protein n=1 Tax=Tanacetum coccineum TaxID=301880 RepID=A0ABQ5BCY6_9ASTR